MIKLAVHNCLPYSSAQSLSLPFRQARKKRKHEDEKLSFSLFPGKYLALQQTNVKKLRCGWTGENCQRKRLTCLICTCCFFYALHSLHYGHMIPHSGRIKAAESIVEFKFLPTLNEHFLLVPLDANLQIQMLHYKTP